MNHAKEANDKKLWEMVCEEIERRYPDMAGWTPRYEERLNKELDIITKHGYAEAFCMIADLIKYIRGLTCRETDIPCYVVGPGREVATSSLVCYLLGITAVDPLKYGLVFERFINDLRENEISINIDIGGKHPNCQSIAEHAKQLYGERLVVQSISPCIRMGIGSVQFNILQLHTISNIDDCIRLIYKNHGKAIDMEKVPISDVVFENIFCTGNTDQVFCFDSDSQQELLLAFQPKSIEDLALLTAVYRPCLFDQIGNLLAARNKMTAPKYISDDLEGILGDTYGIPVYQEQIIRILHELTGFSLNEADVVRRAMSKKDQEMLTVYKGRFIQYTVQNGERAPIAFRLWDWLIEHTSNTFIKSHAVAYAYLSYYTAWLKYYYPCEYQEIVSKE